MTELATQPQSATQSPEPSRRTEITPVDAAIERHLSQRYWDWLTLYRDDASAIPLQHPDMVLTNLEHAPASPLTALLVEIHTDSAALGIGALVPNGVKTQRLGAFPAGWRLNGHRLAGNGFLLPSGSPSILEELLSAALRSVQSQGSDFLLIEDLDEESALAAALRTTLPSSWSLFRHAGIQPRRRIQLPATCDEYWRKFSSKTRQTFRRKLKKFGETRLERITDIADVPRFLEVAHEISKHTWQTRQFGLRVRNDQADLAQLGKLAELGLLRCYLWHVAGEPVAFTIGNQSGGCFHYEEVGYLPEYARNSPGQMMLIQMIDDLIEHDHADWFDFGGGDADYKEQFANHTSSSGTVWLFPPTARGRISSAHLQLSLNARKWTRRAIANLGWTTRFRQWVRRGGAKQPTLTTGDANTQHAPKNAENQPVSC